MTHLDISPNTSLLHHPDLEYVSPIVLKANPDNARVLNRRQRQALRAAIRKSKIMAPIIVDENWMILSGHNRHDAAIKMKIETVPVVRICGMTEVEKRIFALAENRIQVRSLCVFGKIMMQRQVRLILSDVHPY